MPKSTSICNRILALIYNATAWPNVADNASASPLTTIQLALGTVSGTPTDTMSTNEANYTNYVRQTVARTTSGWTAPSAGSTSNVAVVNYPQCGASGNTIVMGKTGVAAGASEVLHYGDLNSPIDVGLNIRPTFDPGAITITEA